MFAKLSHTSSVVRKRIVSCLMALPWIIACSNIECDPITPVGPYNYNFSFDTLITVTKKHLRGVDFITTDLGFVVGHEGTILKTTNGGVTFSKKNSGTINNLWKVHFTSQNVGYVIGDHLTLLKTIDGGETWKEIFSSIPGEHFRAIQFFNDSVGIIAGQAGKIYSTYNGGKAWSLRAFPPVDPNKHTGFDNRNIYSMYWTDMDHGYLGCNFGDFIYYNGTHFRQISLGLSQASSSGIVDFKVLDKTAYMATAQFSNTPNFPSYASIIKTENLWSSFRHSFDYPGDSLQLWAINFYSKSKGVTVGGNTSKSIGAIFVTQTEGIKWESIPIKTKMLYGIDEIDGRIIIVGDSGTVLSNRLQDAK